MVVDLNAVLALVEIVYCRNDRFWLIGIVIFCHNLQHVVVEYKCNITQICNIHKCSNLGAVDIRVLLMFYMKYMGL